MALQLTAVRTVVAAAIMTCPVPTVRALGADTATAQRVVWLTRMTAIRDGALGAGGVVAARRGGAGAAVPWLVGGAVSDAVDAVVITQALRNGRIKGLGPRATVPMAVVAALAGGVTAFRLRRG
jgi:hypothetical protein